MPRSREQLEARINEALVPGFRGRLVARGLARNLVWTEGIIPEGSTEFAVSLTPDLLGYGLALFRLGLELRALDRRNAIAAKAFERAAEAIESVVKDGDPTREDRGLYTVIAATAYHLGHFTARAFSLFPSETERLNLSNCEETLTCLLLRDFRGLREQLYQWVEKGSFDDTLAFDLEEEGKDLSIETAFEFAQESLFHKALSWFDYGLEIGDKAAVDTAVTLLIAGAGDAAEFGSVPFWWTFTIARHLIDDLWDFSLHQHLPIGPQDDEVSRWQNLRWLFITVLQRRRRAEIELWPSQLNAAERALDMTDDLVAALPTSAGKTRIAEICILRSLSLGRRVVFVTPLRALSAQTERSLRLTFSALGFSVSSLYGSSGSTGDDVDSLKNRDIVVSTPEKLDFALRNDPSLIDDVGLIVLDEAHTIGAGEREVRYEVLVQRLLRRHDAGGRRIVCLSAILPQGAQLADFVTWIRQDQPGDAISCDWRPTRQRFGEITWRKTRAVLTFRVEEEAPYVDPFFDQRAGIGRRKKMFPDSLQEFALASVWQLVEDDQTVLVYSPQRSWVIPLAKAVVDLHHRGYLKSLLSVSPDLIQDAVNIGTEWLGEFHPAVQCLNIGVAVHHAQLPRPFLRAIEQLLRTASLKVTIASPTLAQGLNLSATTVLFYALTRSGTIIPGEEFANVAGRAGRAFVDVEGRVLCLATTTNHLRNWTALRNASRERDLRSGLFRLVAEFCNQIAVAKGMSLDDVVEYVMGNAMSWTAPKLAYFQSENHKKEQEDFERKWRSDLASLDSAILSIAQQDISLEDLAKEVDAALVGSLWARTLAHESESKQKVSRALLVGRAKFLWSNTTAPQRKSYFFAGVSFTTGQFLDEHANQLTYFLTTADGAFAAGDIETALQAVIAFAELIFQIEPFKPDELLSDWKQVLEWWIRGINLSDLSGGKEEEVIEMIEGAFVYRLVWALEAMRVRNSALNAEDEAPSVGRAALAIETGTSSVSAALLIQSGVPSRVAAVKAVGDCPASFDSLKGLRRWLFSDAVKTKQEDPSWPTPEMHGPWMEFVSGFSNPASKKWQVQPVQFKADWEVPPPPPGTNVRVLFREDEKETVVYSVELDRLATISPSFAKEPVGLITGYVAEDGLSLDCIYSGPSDIVLQRR